MMMIMMIHIDNENHDVDDCVDDKETAMMMMMMMVCIESNKVDNHNSH